MKKRLLTGIWLSAATLIVFAGIVFFAFKPNAPGCRERSYPHDPDASTQGLVFYNGTLLEGTGRYGGRSSIRRVDPETGRVLDMRPLPVDVFGEGIAVHEGILYQLTWHNGLVFRYDPDTLEPLGQLNIDGEAWGLASDGRRMVMSDGSAVLRFVDPADFSETGRIEAHDENGAVAGLNELEFVGDLLFANLYLKHEAVIIDPSSGSVIDRLDLARYAREVANEARKTETNGIAYDAGSGCLLITGKQWDRLYRIPLPRTLQEKVKSRLQ